MTALGALPAVHVDEELSDEQIDQMLARATARLQRKSDQSAVVKPSDKRSFSFPKLDAGRLDKPYVSTKGEIASVDARRLLEEKQREQANGIRKVEDPVTAKKLALEVSISNTPSALLI